METQVLKLKSLFIIQAVSLFFSAHFIRGTCNPLRSFGYDNKGVEWQ